MVKYTEQRSNAWQRSDTEWRGDEMAAMTARARRTTASSRSWSNSAQKKKKKRSNTRSNIGQAATKKAARQRCKKKNSPPAVPTSGQTGINNGQQWSNGYVKKKGPNNGQTARLEAAEHPPHQPVRRLRPAAGSDGAVAQQQQAGRRLHPPEPCRPNSGQTANSGGQTAAVK